MTPRPAPPSLLLRLVSILLAVGAGMAEAADRQVIAHRGASAYLPEHTLAAYAFAFAQGADVIEPDVVLTADDVAICAHDITMEHTTNVAELYPDRARDDGRHYWIDFTLAEVKTLAATGRRYDGETLPGFTVPTLDEMLALVRHLNTTFGRDVGVFPEAKHPAFHRDHGLSIERTLIATLARHGYTGREHSCLVQSFELGALEIIAQTLQSDLRLVWVTGEAPSEAELDRCARVCVGFGPSRALIEDDDGRFIGADLLAAVRARGLALYPYTFKDEPDAIARFFDRYGATGLFCDNPDVAIEARDD